MKRILIIGCCGAGKTTLALRMGKKLNLPVYHLDQLWWLPRWIEELPGNFDIKLAEILPKDRWIIDGNYNRTLAERLKYADTVILIDYSRVRCMAQALGRIWRLHGKTRIDMTKDCPERFDWEFLRYIWNFNRDMRPRLLETLRGFAGQVICAKTPGELKSKLLISCKYTD